MLCDDLEGWDGRWGEREAQEGGDICILTADSHCCTIETNTTFLSNYLPHPKDLYSQPPKLCTFDFSFIVMCT